MFIIITCTDIEIVSQSTMRNPCGDVNFLYLDYSSECLIMDLYVNV